MADDISISGSSPAEKKKQEKLFMRAFFRKAGKAIYDYGLIAPGDKILVGVSGGKDSLALLEVLALRERDPKQDYTVVAAHIAVENVAYEVDAAYLGDFCARLGVRFVSRTIRSDVRDGSSKPACFVCAWHRRKALFEIAKEEGCCKLALAHHRDDAVESLLMSMMFNGTIASMPPKLSMFGRNTSSVRKSFLMTMYFCFSPMGLTISSMPVTVPHTPEYTLALTAPLASAISCPFTTASPAFTTGIAGAPMCWETLIFTISGAGIVSIGFSRQSSLRSFT